ncbi:MAG: efflux RND transporter periplasmic adaptor subunit [bacterium]
MTTQRKSVTTTLAIIFVTVLAPLIAGCNARSKEAPALLLRPVQVMTPVEGTITPTVSVSGSIIPRKEAEILSKISGRVLSVYREEGDFVHSGDVLIQLEKDEISAQLEQAQASLLTAQAHLSQAKTGHSFGETQVSTSILQALQGKRQAENAVKAAKSDFDNNERQIERMKKLFEKGAIASQQMEATQLAYDISKNRYDSSMAQQKQAEESYSLAQASIAQNTIRQDDVKLAEAGLEQARASLALARIRFENTSIKTPITGVITFRDVDPGDIISSSESGKGKALMNVTDNRLVRLEGDVTEEEMQDVTAGQRATVTADAIPGKAFSGKVETLIASADPRSRSFRVKIRVDNPGAVLKSGMFARATLYKRSLSGIILPRHLVLNKDGQFAVMIKDGNKARLRQVQIGWGNEEKILIIAGISSKDQVISTGQETLQDGDTIEIEKGRQ